MSCSVSISKYQARLSSSCFHGLDQETYKYDICTHTPASPPFLDFYSDEQSSV